MDAGTGAEPLAVPELTPEAAGSGRPRGRRGMRLAVAAAVVLGATVGSAAIADAVTAPSAPHGPEHHGMTPFGPPPAAFGTVASVGTGSFTLTTRDGTTVTVAVDGSTTYLDHGVTSPTLADVKAGETVAAFGTRSADTVTATKVIIGLPLKAMGGHHGMPPFGTTPPAAFGTVASVGTGSFTLTTRDGTTVTVAVDGSTTYIDGAVASPSFSDVTVGALVAVFGTTSSGTVAATKVIVVPARTGDDDGPTATGPSTPTTEPTEPAGDDDGHGADHGMPAAMGTVATVGSGSFTVSASGGSSVTVTVGTTTTYRGHDGAAASFSSIVVGARVVVFGTASSGTVAATTVLVDAPDSQEPPAAQEGAGGQEPERHGGTWTPPPAPPATSPATAPAGGGTAPSTSVPAQDQPSIWGGGGGAGSTRYR